MEPTPHDCGERCRFDAVAGLPEQEQSILILRLVLDLTDSEIGEALGLSRSVVQRRRTKSLARFLAVNQPLPLVGLAGVDTPEAVEPEKNLFLGKERLI